MAGRLSGDHGASTVEYGLIVFAIAAVVAAAVVAFGGVLNSSYTSSCDAMVTTRTAYDSSVNASC